MISHYLRLALRLLRKQRLYASINIIGLSIALGLATLIFLFVRDELTFDHWHENADRIVRIDRVDFYPDGTVDDQGPWLPYPFAEALKRDHPAVESTVRMMDSNVIIRVRGEASEQPVLFVDSTFLNVFSYDLIHGDQESALVDPGSVVLTKTAALRHFNTLDVVGRSLEIRFDETYEPAVVTAVVGDPPSNTNLPFEYLLPFHRTPMVYAWVANRTDRWNASSFNVFALLYPDVDRDAAQATLAGLWKKYYADRTEDMRRRGTWDGEGDPAAYTFVPLKSLHLDTAVQGSLVATSDPLYSAILVAIGITILGLACINFILLTIGRGATRATEIGLRKAIGARRSQLMAQFGSESILLSLLALGLGIGLASLLLPTFNALSGKTLSLNLGRDLPVVAALVGIALVTGIVAGWYPSLVISRHRPADALRGRFSLGGSSPLTRTLVVAQFTASIVLVAGALVMNQQMKYIQQRDLGYDPSNVIVVHANGTDGREMTRHLEQTVGTRADVENIAAMSFSMNRGYSHEGWLADGIERFAYVYNVEPEVLELLDVELVAGRLLDPRYASDSTYAAVVNESFADQIGLTPEEAVGTRISGYGESPPFIVGVVRDLNFRSLHEEVSSMIMTMDPDRGLRYALVKVNGPDPSGAIAALNEAWASFAPDVPFKYTFLDADVALTYVNDKRWSRVVRYAAAVAILVACMGLFGLAALSIARRTKEIGVRKVLGASVGSILVLVSRDFAKLVLVATLVGAPIAWFALQKWLEGFAYHVNPSLWVFSAAGLTVLAIALGTVAYHAVRAAVGNPVDALRYE